VAARNELHSLIVEPGKRGCHPVPVGTACPLRPDCPGRVALF